MIDQKEAYHYQNYIKRLEKARLRVVPGLAYIHTYSPNKNTPYAIAETFMEIVRDSQKKSDFDDFFKQKVEMGEDRVHLILGEITGRDNLKYENLARLYYDLSRVDQWRAEMPFSVYYHKDRTWSDLNKMELQLRGPDTQRAQRLLPNI